MLRRDKAQILQRTLGGHCVRAGLLHCALPQSLGGRKAVCLLSVYALLWLRSQQGRPDGRAVWKPGCNPPVTQCGVLWLSQLLSIEAVVIDLEIGPQSREGWVTWDSTHRRGIKSMHGWGDCSSEDCCGLVSFLAQMLVQNSSLRSPKCSCWGNFLGSQIWWLILEKEKPKTARWNLPPPWHELFAQRLGRHGEEVTTGLS